MMEIECQKDSPFPLFFPRIGVCVNAPSAPSAPFFPPPRFLGKQDKLVIILLRD